MTAIFRGNDGNFSREGRHFSRGRTAVYPQSPVTPHLMLAILRVHRYEDSTDAGAGKEQIQKLQAIIEMSAEPIAGTQATRL
jgi:hypothetical protein